jgi:signal transduction histidine kinase
VFPSLASRVLHEGISLLEAEGTQSRTMRLSRAGRIIELTLERIQLANGEVAALAAARDVTEQALAEAEARALEDQMSHQQRLRAVGELAFGIAHDVNNVLGALRIRLSLLRQEPLSVRQGENLAAIERILGEGAALVSKLQRVGRAEPLRVAEVSLAQLIETAVEIAESGLRARSVQIGAGLRVEVDLPPLPPVLGYPQELQHVFLNLLLNARDAMPAGGVIRISGEVIGQQVRIRVEDEGTGIPPDQLETIFDPFFTTKGQEGTGMGLAMARRIVERLGGTISAHNRPDRGACIVLTFRTADAPALAEPALSTLGA